MKNQESRIREQNRSLGARGFTLVEMIVSLAVFSVVAVVALAALIKIIDANNKAQTLAASITNLNFALESMSRELRTGTTYDCENTTVVGFYSGSVPCARGYDQDDLGSHITFTSSKSITTGSGSPCSAAIVYRFVPNNTPNASSWSLQKATQSSCIANPPVADGDFSSVVDPSVVITGYHIQVSADNFPLALVHISGYAGTAEKTKSYFDVQTAVSARTGSED